MTLTKEVVIDQITVLENGTLQIREATRIMEDGVQLTQTYHRHCFTPGDDTEGQDERVKAVCKAVHTEKVVKEYKDKQKEQEKAQEKKEAPVIPEATPATPEIPEVAPEPV
jgi:hypothetical protein